MLSLFLVPKLRRVYSEVVNTEPTFAACRVSFLHLVFHTYSLLSPLMKLPRLRVLVLLPPLKNVPFAGLEGAPLLESRFFPLPPMQNKTVEIRKQAKAAHMNPKAYVPMSEDCPLLRKWSRPLT